MPSKITFTSARLESFSRSQKIGTAQFACSWNKKAADALEWSELPDSVAGADLDGDIAASVLELTPADKPLAKHAIELDITRVHKFEAVRLELEGKQGKGHRLEVRFKVSFVAPAVCEILESYMLTVGEGKGTLTVSYAKQESLPLEQQQAISAEMDATFQ